MTFKRDVVQSDIGAYVDLGRDGLLLVRFGDRPAVFGAGWSPLFAHIGFAPFILLELRHANGESATWILDRQGKHITDSIKSLSPADQDALIINLSPVMTGLFNGIFLKDPPSFSFMDTIDFFSLNQKFRNELGQFYKAPEPLLPNAIGLHEWKDTELKGHDGATITLRRTDIQNCLETDVDARYVAACKTGSMTWPSPVDGSEVTEVRGLVISHLLIAWRCVDRRNGVLFFVLAAGFGAPIGAIYFPSLNLLLSKPRTSHTDIDIINFPFIKAIAEHALEYGEILFSFLAHPIVRFAQFTWPSPASHIGHYLWNELAGFERITQALEPEHYPLIYDLGGAQGTDFYGPVQQLFPELRGQVIRSKASYGEMLQHAYRSGIQVLRFSGSYVSAEMRKRIMNVVATTQTAEDARRAIWETAGPVVVFGLRVENRTLVDLGGFYTELAKKLACRFGALTIIIDGHNSKSQADKALTFSSYLEHRASHRPFDVERQMVEMIKVGLLGLPVTVIDCVGMTVLDNLAWMALANYCVAPWGAGLAKYRWVLNLPSFVMINNYGRHNKSDIDIYDNPFFMEMPTKQLFIDPSLVLDQPDIQTLVKMDNFLLPYYMNYEVDAEGAYSEISKVISEFEIDSVNWSRRRPHSLLRIEGEKADVLIGSNDELFLARGGHYILDHAFGYMTPLNRSYLNFSANINRRSKLAESVGASYAHIIFPDKQSVLPTAFGEPNLICLGKLYLASCSDVQHHIVYPVNELTVSPTQVFLKTDTHMTHAGTLAVIEVLLEKLLGSAGDKWIATMRQGLTKNRKFLGDLGGKLQPQRLETTASLIFDQNISHFSNDMTSGNNGAVVVYCYPYAPRPERVVIFGDSFCADLAWVLAHFFQEIVFLRTPYVHDEMVQMIQPDILLSGNVERYLHFVESDSDRPYFPFMNTIEHGDSEAKRNFSTVFSAMNATGRRPYFRMFDKAFYGTSE